MINTIDVCRDVCTYIQKYAILKGTFQKKNLFILFTSMQRNLLCTETFIHESVRDKNKKSDSQNQWV